MAATPAERDATALSASSSFFPGVLTKVSVGASPPLVVSSRHSPILPPRRRRGPRRGGRTRVIATKSLRGIEEVPQLGTHKT